MCLGNAIRLADCCARGLCFVGSSSARVMKKDVKMGYGMLHILFSAFLFILMYFGTQYLGWAQGFIGCPTGPSQESCLGLSSAYRYF